MIEQLFIIFIIILIGAVAYSYPQVVNKYGSGFGPIWLDNLRCTGNENSLFSCPANAVGNHNCVHLEDAGVKCGKTE